jgi:pimeloyl-ACP methyl ester carboxylesterase
MSSDLKSGKKIPGWSCKVFLLLALAAGVAGCTSVEDRAGVIENPSGTQSPAPRDFIFHDAGRAVYYSFAVGSPVSESPVIFFISGSGCESVKRRFPVFFDPVKARLNADVFVLQKRGIEDGADGKTCSDTFRESAYFDRIVADQKEFIDAMYQSMQRKPKIVVIIGVSEGALVAARIAALDDRFTNVALIGGGGTSMRENLRLLAGKHWYFGNLQTTLDRIDANPDSLEMTAWGHSYKYWSSMLDVDVGDLLLKTNALILLGMGEKDESVPVETIPKLREKFAAAGKNNLSVYIYPDANHRLYSSAQSHSYSREFLEALVADIDKAGHR